MIKIDKNIPFPNGKSDRKYPLIEMEVGDSFFIPCKEEDEKRIRASIYTSARRNKLTTSHKRKYTTRKVDGGLRTWRTN